MSARMLLLATTLGAVVATSSCSAVIQDSDAGSTLPPLRSEPIDVDDVRPPSSEASESDDSLPADSTTSTSAASTTTSTTTTSTTSTTSTSTTVAPQVDLAAGAQVTIGSRTLSFSRACRSGDNLVLDGVTWAFAGNSFRFSGEDDIRSAAELVGDGWTMPMLVASVRSGVYTYVGRAVEGSVSSAEVIVDHGALDSC